MIANIRSSPLDAFPIKQVFRKILQNLQEKTEVRVSFLIKLQTKKETLAQVLSCESCEIFNDSFFIEHHQRLPL